MSPAAPQTELFPRPAATPGTIFVNDRVCIQSEENQRVISVHGIVFSHYSSKDHSAEAYAMVQLFESGYADQNDIARCFSYSARTLRRYQERFKAGGLSALARPRGRPAACSPVYKKLPGRDRTILRLKTKEMSNRWIAGRLGLSEKAVRKSLRRLGWKPGPEPSLSFLPEARSQVQLAVASASTLLETPPSVTDQPAEKMPQLPTEAAAKSLDANPLDRSMDCLLAAMDFSTMPFRCLLPHEACQGQAFCWPFLCSWPVACSRQPRKFMAASAPPSTDYEQLWLLMFCWRF